MKRSLKEEDSRGPKHVSGDFMKCNVMQGMICTGGCVCGAFLEAGRGRKDMGMCESALADFPAPFLFRPLT